MSNDFETLQLQFRTWKSDRFPELSDADAFEIFCADQFLKDRNLSDSELQEGIMDGSEDGGIDSIYIFFNGRLLNEQLDVDSREGGIVEVKIFQSKLKKGPSPTTLEKIERFLNDLLAFNKTSVDLTYTYHSELITYIQSFKDKFRELSKRSTPRLDIEIILATMTDAFAGVSAQKAAEKLVQHCEKHYSESTIHPIKFVGAKELWARCRTKPLQKKSIRLTESFSTLEGWVALVELGDFFEFLKNTDNLSIDENIFDANVRGYQSASGVNKRITKSLRANELEFWQLNNGITILSPKATFSDRILEIENPQIVNGLQTSRRIFEHFSANPSTTDENKRHVLIRVIKTDDELRKSEIIRATNDQNTMPAEAFLSTMRIQHQIEEYFSSKGLYYERRKGYYKSLGKQANVIVEMLELIQALVAIVRREPEVARGAPRNYLKDEKRKTIFGSDETIDQDAVPALPLNVYLNCVLFMRKSREFLLSKGLDRPTLKNLQGYIALHVVSSILGKGKFAPSDFIEIDLDSITEQSWNQSFKFVRKLYKDHGANDNAVKNKTMANALRQHLSNKYDRPKSSRIR